MEWGSGPKGSDRKGFALRTLPIYAEAKIIHSFIIIFIFIFHCSGPSFFFNLFPLPMIWIDKVAKSSGQSSSLESLTQLHTNLYEHRPGSCFFARLPVPDPDPLILFATFPHRTHEHMTSPADRKIEKGTKSPAICAPYASGPPQAPPLWFSQRLNALALVNELPNCLTLLSRTMIS